MEILWQDCFTDNRIRSALRDLPTDLEETYRRCVQRMTFANSYALRVLQWVSFAARPLHIDELKEAVAFDLEDVTWDSGKIPQADVVIGCGANLVAVDPSDQCVRFAHPSVKTYLLKDADSANSIPKYPKSDEQGELLCGEFCVAYLSFSNFNLALVKPANETEVVKVPNTKLLAGDALASPLARFFWGRGTNPKPPTQVQFRRIRSATIPDRSQYKFLDYAVSHWTLQTKEIPFDSLVWGKFRQLSLSFNETWNFHPWVVGGRSQISRLHGLFGWAVKNEHIPLLKLALNSERDIREICNLPLIDERLPALHLASKLGFLEVVRLILPVCQLNLQDEEGYTALHHAASRGHLRVVAKLLHLPNTKIDIPSKTQVTPLWLAAKHGHCDVVQVLAERQADFEVKESVMRRTPLMMAASNGHRAVVDYMLSKRAYMEAKDAEGRTPLSWAIMNEHVDTIEILLERGANPACKFANKGQLLLWAAQTGHAAITGLLAKNGMTNLNAPDDDGLTGLWWAVQNGNLYIANILLDAGANREIRDADGQTLLLLAARNKNEALTELLLKKGAVFWAQDKQKRTALFWAVKNNHECIVKLLLDRVGNQPAARKRLLSAIALRAVQMRNDDAVQSSLGEKGDFEDEMPLLSAIRKSHEWLTQLFMEIDPNADRETVLKEATSMWSTENGQMSLLELLVGEKSKDDDDKSNLKKLLLQAVEKGDEHSVKLLVYWGADIHARNVYGETALWWAARKGHASLVEFFYDKGADIESQDKFGLTPLAWAVENGYWEVVKLLVGWGANIWARDKSGQTPVTRADGKGMRNLLLGE